MLFVLAATMRQYFSAGKTMNVNNKSCLTLSNAKLNPICHLVALLGARCILHISRISVNNLYDFSLIKNVQTNGTIDTNSDIIKRVQIVYLLT
jgi:hypothetical protein